MTKKKRDEAPPQAPQIPKKFSFPLVQVIGMPLLALIPILALFGFFGETRQQVETANEQLELRVEYPSRLRYKTTDTLTVEVWNISGEPVDSAVVRFDREYVEAFSATAFTPSIRSITGDLFLLELSDLPPGEYRAISLGLQAEKYGRQKGTISVAVGSETPLEVSVETLIFP